MAASAMLGFSYLGDPTRAKLAEAEHGRTKASIRLRDARLGLMQFRDSIGSVLETLNGAAALDVETAGFRTVFQAAFDREAGELWPRDVEAVVLDIPVEE